MYPKRNIRLLLAVNFLQGLVFYTSIAALYRQAAGLTLFEIGLIESISLVASLLLEVPWGVAAERIGYRRTLILCNAVFFVSKLVFWRADSFASFVLERLLLAVAISGLSGVDTSYLYLSCREEDAQRVFGQYNAFGTAGLLLASFVYAAFLAGRYRLTALLTAVAYGAAALLTLPLTEVRPPKQERQSALASFGQSARLLLKTRGLLPLVLCGALFFETCRMTTVFYSQLQFVRAGFTERAIGMAGVIMSLAQLSSAKSASLTERFGQRRFGTAVLLLSALAFGAMALTANAALSLLAVLALCGAVCLFSPLSSALENRLIVTDDRATALSVNALLVDGVCIAIDPLFGRAAEVSLPTAFALSAALCLAACALFLAAERAASFTTSKQ